MFLCLSAQQGPECCKEVTKPSVASFFQPRSAKKAAAVKEEALEERGGAVQETVGERAAAAKAAKAVKEEAQALPEQRGAADPQSAAVNADEQPGSRQAAANDSAAGQQAAESRGQMGSPQTKRKQPGAASGPAKRQVTASSAKKAKIPGQLDIKSFFKT